MDEKTYQGSYSYTFHMKISNTEFFSTMITSIGVATAHIIVILIRAHCISRVLSKNGN